MKLFFTCLLAAAFLTFLSGCAQQTDSSGYSPGQVRARHSSYDPTSPR